MALKGQCHKIVNTFLKSKTLLGPHMNKQKGGGGTVVAGGPPSPARSCYKLDLKIHLDVALCLLL